METEDEFVWTSVRAVCREYPAVESLPHAVQLINAYVDNISLSVLPDVLKRGQTHMFYHALHAVERSSTLVHHEKLRQYRMAMHVVPAKMTAEEGALKAMQDLYARYRSCVDSETIAAACEMADLSVLKWLRAREPDLIFTKFEWSKPSALMHASRKGRLDVVRWLTELFPGRIQTLVHAAHGGHLNLVKWLMKQPQWDRKVDGAFFVAVARGHVNVAQFLQKKRSASFMNVRISLAYEYGLELDVWRRRNADPNTKFSAVEAAASGNHIEMVKWLHVNYPMHFSASTMDCAAWNGHLEVVRFLHFNRHEGCTTRAMDNAAANGHLEVVQWLHENRSEGCTTDAKDSAASNGHLDILKWLCDNRHEGCTSSGMVRAVRQNRFEIAKWLHEHQKQEFPGEIVVKLAQAGDLEMITWLHSNGKTGWSKETMNRAASNGHLDIVKFLHENRREGCTKQAMNLAAGNNHLDVVKWLHANRREGCSVLAMTYAASEGHLEMIKWLHTHRGEGCAPAAMTGAAAGGHIRVMEFLAANFSLQWPPTTMKNAVENNQLAAVKWLHAHLQPLSKKDAIHAARSENIGILEYIRSTAEDCITPTVYFAGFTKNYPEVVKWYEDHYGNPRKRKTPSQ